MLLHRWRVSTSFFLSLLSIRARRLYRHSRGPWKTPRLPSAECEAHCVRITQTISYPEAVKEHMKTNNIQPFFGIPFTSSPTLSYNDACDFSLHFGITFFLPVIASCNRNLRPSTGGLQWSSLKVIAFLEFLSHFQIVAGLNPAILYNEQWKRCWL